jgi:hypothetical protein
MEKATLRLFNAIQVNSKDYKEIPRAVLERTIRHGYVLDPAIKPEDSLLDSIEAVIGISGEKANASFHKSWSIVQESSMETLVLQQIVHYLTTYGFEQLGIYHEDAVYIPRETLELSAIEEDIPLVVIRAMDAQEILDAIVKLGSGIALAQQTLDDIMIIIEANKYESGFVENIANRELKALLYDFYGLVPSEPVEFLRHLVSKLTDESLLIKNDRLIEKIKQANGKFLDALLKDAPDDLASIFFRFKPLFLAMKSISRNKNFFNQLRKKADKLHVPMPEDYLNSVTVQVKRGMLDLDALNKRLEKASIFRKIRLAYALKHRLHASNSIVYKVRNGRGWATEFDWPEVLQSLTQDALDKVVLSIADDMSENVNGKTIYIPEDVHYALPATEKQFTGNLPNGTSVSVPNDLVVGIHWTNTNKRVDLDLSVIGESGKIGWDADYRSKDKDVLFSGDMTDARAPKGASELFYLREGQGEARILMVNYFNFMDGDEVEAKILVAHEHPRRFGMNYMVDVNNIIASANINITKKQNILGLIAQVKGQNRVYFSSVSVGNSITSYGSEQSAHSRIYLVESLENSLDFREILGMAGAIVLDEKMGKIDIDLSPERLNKSTIINMIKPGT